MGEQALPGISLSTSMSAPQKGRREQASHSVPT